MFHNKRKLFLFHPTLANGPWRDPHISFLSFHALPIIDSPKALHLFILVLYFYHTFSCSLSFYFEYGIKRVLRHVTNFYQITRRHISIDSNSHSHSIQNLRSHRDKLFVYQMNKYQMAITNTVFWNPFISEQWWSSKNSLHIFTSWSSAEFEKLGFITVFSDCRCVFILGNLP